MSKELEEEINIGDFNILVDGAEGGSFWFMDKDDNWIRIPYSKTKEVIDFLNGWMIKVENYKNKKEK